jgi:transposase-like protein
MGPPAPDDPPLEFPVLLEFPAVLLVLKQPVSPAAPTAANVLFRNFLRPVSLLSRRIRMNDDCYQPIYNFSSVATAVSATGMKYQSLLPATTMYETGREDTEQPRTTRFNSCVSGVVSWVSGLAGRRPATLPHCGETTVWKNGYRTDRLLAVLITEDGFDEITVEIQRYQCSACRCPYDSDILELFYEELEYAKPVFDLCLFRAATNPFHACERIPRTALST